MIPKTAFIVGYKMATSSSAKTKRKVIVMPNAHRIIIVINFAES